MLTFTLTDDGTMDTLVIVDCTVCKRSWEERIMGDYASDFRDPNTGEMMHLEELCETLDIFCECELE